VLLCAAFAVFFSTFAFATTMTQLSDEQMVKLSKRIVEGRVTETRSEWNGAHNQIRTTVTIDVSQMLKGQMPANRRLVFEQLGGQVGDIIMDITDQPAFKVDETVIVFLRDPSPAPTPVVGLTQGKLNLVRDPDTGILTVQGRNLSRDVFVRNISRVVVEQEGGR